MGGGAPLPSCITCCCCTRSYSPVHTHTHIRSTCASHRTAPSFMLHQLSASGDTHTGMHAGLFGSILNQSKSKAGPLRC